MQQPIEDGARNREPQHHSDDGIGRCALSFAAVHLLTHAGGEALADQPSDDQHHGLDSERDHQGQQRLVGEVAHAVPSAPTGCQGQDDGCSTKQRKLPVGEHHLLDHLPDTRDKPVRPEGVGDGSEGQEKNEEATPSLGTHVAQDRKGAVRDRLEFHARIPRSTAVSLQPGNALCRLMPIVVELGSTSHNRSVCLRAPALSRRH